MEAGVPRWNDIMITRYLHKIPKGQAGKVQGTRFQEEKYHPLKSIKDAMNTAKALSALFEMGEDPLAPRKRASDREYFTSSRKLNRSHSKRTGHRTLECRKKAQVTQETRPTATGNGSSSKAEVKF